MIEEVLGKLHPTVGVGAGELEVHHRLVGLVEADIRGVEMLAGERRRHRLELPGVFLVGDLDLELRLSRGDVVGLLDVIDAGQLEKDLVVTDRLNDGLRDAETVDSPVDDPPRSVVVIGDALTGGNVGDVHL